MVDIIITVKFTLTFSNNPKYMYYKIQDLGKHCEEKD